MKTFKGDTTTDITCAHIMSKITKLRDKRDRSEAHETFRFTKIV